MASQGPRYGRLGCDTAERPYDTADSTRVHGLARGELRYKNCIVAGGVRLCRNMARLGCDTARSSATILPGGAG